MMHLIKYIRHQVDGHTVAEFVNGSRACSCGLERGIPPTLRVPSLDAMSAHELEEGMRLKMPTGQIMRVTHIDKPKAGEVGYVTVTVEEDNE